MESQVINNSFLKLNYWVYDLQMNIAHLTLARISEHNEFFAECKKYKDMIYSILELIDD